MKQSTNKDKFLCPEHLSGRVDKVLAISFPDISRSLIKKAIEENRVTKIDGSSLEPKSKIFSGDELLIDLNRPNSDLLKPYAFPLDVLFEDESILVINKISGMVVHPGDGTGGHFGSCINKYTTQICPLVCQIAPVSFTDWIKETSGVMVVAKTEEAYHELVRQFASREVDKEYVALVKGVLLQESGEYDGPIGRHPKFRFKMCVRDNGKPAVTRWRVIQKFGQDYSLINCKILTGRTHQIRVHFSNAGHPLVGDLTYGSTKKNKQTTEVRLMLHAANLGF